MAAHSERVRSLFRELGGRRLLRFAGVGVVAFAAVPLVIGVRIPALNEPRLVFASEQSRYPTADGHWPMGGSVGFLSGFRGERGAAGLDHNGRLWKSLATVDFQEYNGKARWRSSRTLCRRADSRRQLQRARCKRDRRSRTSFDRRSSGKWLPCHREGWWMVPSRGVSG